MKSIVAIIASLFALSAFANESAPATTEMNAEPTAKAVTKKAKKGKKGKKGKKAKKAHGSASESAAPATPAEPAPAAEAAPAHGTGH